MRGNTKHSQKKAQGIDLFQKVLNPREKALSCQLNKGMNFKYGEEKRAFQARKPGKTLQRNKERRKGGEILKRPFPGKESGDGWRKGLDALPTQP